MNTIQIYGLPHNSYFPAIPDGEEGERQPRQDKRQNATTHGCRGRDGNTVPNPKGREIGRADMSAEEIVKEELRIRYNPPKDTETPHEQCAVYTWHK